ncbi:TetR/AcrR family transcriptional regulator [Nonomuraea dietziae]|uniref:TetR/AcrR family transcriptional regulator n=1 Tax=Nonomuraea dietziae TaxID=65515 RepID=UPI00343D25F3
MPQASGRTRRTQAERSQATTTELVATAQRLFGEKGYDAISIEDIAHASGMTKGAVYHHFPGKRALFRAVFVVQEQQLAERIAAAGAEATDPWEGVRGGAQAFLEACADQQVRQVILLDGPAVLGWDDVRAIEYEHTLNLLHTGIADAADQGQIAPGHTMIRAHLIFGALCELGMLIARADHPTDVLPVMLKQVDQMLAALAKTPPSRYLVGRPSPGRSA